jgi:hypothetical protein
VLTNSYFDSNNLKATVLKENNEFQNVWKEFGHMKKILIEILSSTQKLGKYH